MTALDFPNSPTVGQTFAPGGGALSYMFDGTRWRIAGGLVAPSGLVGYAEITSSIAGFTTIADVAGLSVTFNAIAGRTYKMTAQLMAFSSVANDMGSIVIANGANAVQTQQNQLYGIALNTSSIGGEAVKVATASGPLTYKVQYQRAAGSGTHTIYGHPNFPAFLLVEDITYQPGGGVGTVIPAPGAWINATLLNGWVNYGGAFQNLQYRLFGGDMVQVRGAIKNGSLSTPAFQLPAGFRPPAQVTGLTIGSTTNVEGAADIGVGGDVIIYGANNTMHRFLFDFSITP